MRTCILHAGLSKTGSTVIQGFLEERRGAFAAGGLDVPKLGYSDVVTAGLALARELREERRPEAPATASWRALDAHLARTSGDLLISRESFGQSLSRPQGAAFANAFFASRGVRLRIVAFMRDPVDFLNSAYAQNARRLRVTQPFEDWAETTLAPGDPRFSPWLMFRHVIDAPLTEVTALPFGASPAGPLPMFLDAIGFGGLDDGSFDDAPYRNASLGPKAIAAAIEVGRALAPKRLSPLEFLHYSNTFGAAVARRGWSEEPFYAPDHLFADRISAHFAEENDRFARAVWNARWSERVPRRPRRQCVADPIRMSAADKADIHDLVRETLLRGAFRAIKHRVRHLGGLLREPSITPWRVP